MQNPLLSVQPLSAVLFVSLYASARSVAFIHPQISSRDVAYDVSSLVASSKEPSQRRETSYSRRFKRLITERE